MIYSEIKSQIKTGDILGWTHRTWKSWYDIQIQVVRMVTRSEFSHVATAYVEDGEVYVIEAVGSGVRKKLLSEDVPFYWVKAEPLNQEAISFLIEQVGKPYEAKWKMVINFFWNLNLQKNKEWQCSELVNAARRANKTPLTFIDEPSAVMQECWKRFGEISYVDNQ